MHLNKPKTAHFNDDDLGNNPRQVSRELDVEAQDHAQPSLSPNIHGQARVITSEHASPHSTGTHSPFPSHNRKRTESMATRSSFKSLRKRRADTQNISYGAVEMGRTTGWTPGAEPGVDTSESAPPYIETGAIDGDAVNPGMLNQQCEITCVDYSEDGMNMVTLDNDNLEEYLQQPKPQWSQVRWISVNGLSWDVIRIIGNLKGLHRLAIEDLMNTRSRTKTDWYRDHAFIILPLQKLVNLDLSTGNGSDSDEDEDDDDDNNNNDDNEKGTKRSINIDADGVEEIATGTRYMHEKERRRREERHKKRHKGAIATLIEEFLHPHRREEHSQRPRNQLHLNPSNSFKKSSKIRAPWISRPIRTLQRWHAGTNQDRTQFMERNSALSAKGLSVSIEQVSMFLCSDNTVISFFEYSAQDIEAPIVKRLQTPGTILRQSCDASMLVQAILDGIVDLAIPVTTAYEDILGDLELEVLTDPAIHESKLLYILTSEIATLRGAIAPVAKLMSALKDHKDESSTVLIQGTSGLVTPGTELAQNPLGLENASNPDVSGRPQVPTRKSFATPTTVNISPLTVIYLGDALDHALLIRDSYDQMRRSADNLVDLIFNTISAYQNESMKTLTLITCFFLPLTFMTGYFGMNFEQFPAIKKSDTYFWVIAAPVSAFVLLLMLYSTITRFFGKAANRALIARSRKRRLEKVK